MRSRSCRLLLHRGIVLVGLDSLRREYTDGRPRFRPAVFLRVHNLVFDLAAAARRTIGLGDGGNARLRTRGRLRLSEHLRHQLPSIVRTKRSESRNALRRREIPGVLRKADEIPNGGVAAPGAA